MGFQLVDYDLLSKYIRESISTELQHHRIHKKDLTKALNALAINHLDRAIQCKYLLVVLDSLDKSGNKDQRVLNAAVYYIREQIDESYQGTVTPFFVSPVRSNLFNSLTTSLTLTVENRPDDNDLLSMYVALYKFMLANIYKDSDPVKGYLELDKQPFSPDKIVGYKVEEVLQDLVIKIAGLESKQIELTKAKQVQDKKSDMQAFRLFSTRFASTESTLPPKPVVIHC